MGFVIKEVKYDDIEFQKLCKKLDEFQNELYPERIKLGLNALDGLNKLKKIFIIYDKDKAVACGGLKEANKEVAELSRMYTDRNYRGQGLAKRIIKEVIKSAKEKGYKKIILDTWKKSDSAIKLYISLGFKETEPFDSKTFKNSFSTKNENVKKQIQDNLVFMELEI